ncbi:MAG TPA: DUF6491 family protein [Gammaproteobacteria bacterium]|nr:DUF6491 family protein [Gammaproteobacteria bacterium]
MNILKIAVPVVVCATVLGGCASARGPSTAKILGDTTGQNGRACVRLNDIQGYGVLDDNIISINTLGQDYYLATVLPGCNDLQTSIGVLFKGGFGEICGQSMNAVATNSDTCAINKIYKFENREAAFASYNDARQKRKAMQENPQS